MSIITLKSDSQTNPALIITTVVILLGSSFRVAELLGGFHGQLWNREVDSMVLDGTVLWLLLLQSILLFSILDSHFMDDEAFSNAVRTSHNITS